MNRTQKGNEKGHNLDGNLAAGQRGAALLMVLILTGISFAFTVGLTYVVTSAIQMSGGQKRYQTALEGARGGVVTALQMIEARGNPSIPLDNFSIPAQNVGGVDCLTDKLNNATLLPDGTLNWDPSCSLSLNVDPLDPTTYDMTFTTGAAPDPVFRVYAKIVDTVNGNSGPSSGLVKTGVVLTTPGEITVMNIPYLYTLEVLGTEAVNPMERARMSAVHLY